MISDITCYCVVPLIKEAVTKVSCLESSDKIET